MSCLSQAATTRFYVQANIYRDTFTYDTQAWKLAASGDPLWKAFDRSSGIEEQYGGLTFTLSLTYRLFSPDAHRPWLTILLSALMGVLGVALAWKAARLAWGERVALFWGGSWRSIQNRFFRAVPRYASHS